MVFYMLSFDYVNSLLMDDFCRLSLFYHKWFRVLYGIVDDLAFTFSLPKLTFPLLPFNPYPSHNPCKILLIIMLHLAFKWLIN